MDRPAGALWWGYCLQEDSARKPHLHRIARMAPTKNSLNDLASAYFSDITFPQSFTKVNYLPCLKTPWSLVARCHDTDNPFAFSHSDFCSNVGESIFHISHLMSLPCNSQFPDFCWTECSLKYTLLVTICLSISYKKNASTQHPAHFRGSLSGFERLSFWHVNFVESKLKKKVQN